MIVLYTIIINLFVMGLGVFIWKAYTPPYFDDKGNLTNIKLTGSHLRGRLVGRCILMGSSLLLMIAMISYTTGLPEAHHYTWIYIAVMTSIIFAIIYGLKKISKGKY